MCGAECKLSGIWFRDDKSYTCNTGSGYIRTNDPALCQHPGVWADVPCSRYWSDGRVSRYGLRCSGQKMSCVYPWYTLYDGEPYSDEVSQCPDKSDQVFNSSLTCREHLKQHSDFHTQKFCNENYFHDKWPYLDTRRICKNKTQWLSERDPSYSDPHSCQSSCSVPGPDCLACSNSSYFACPKSGQCVHPDLVCDSHPQCVEGEDEELSMCYDAFIKLKIIQPLAQFRCQSLFYKNMETFAIPRNSRTECGDQSDEAVPRDYSKIFLVTSTLAIITFYITLKYSGLAKKMLTADNQNIASSVETDQNMYQNYRYYNTLYLENYREKSRSK